MEFEQLIKRIDWLEKQNRKDKETIASLGERLDSIEGNLDALAKQIKTLTKAASEISGASARLNQFDEMFSKQRADMIASVNAIEKKAQTREREAAKRHQGELEKLNDAIAALRKASDTGDIRKQLKDKAAEEIRTTQSITDLKARLEEIALANNQIQRSQKATDEARRQDLKRAADLQGDLTALRKRLDETRDKMQLNIDSLRNVESRMNELLAAESERKQSQATFIEQQSLAQVERERAWKEWNSRVDEFKKQASSLDAQLQAAEDATRAAKRAQDAYLELNQKLERRINEVTEMQRLGDERARQEWASFKSEDQKRWTSYTLSQDETLRDLRGSLENASTRVEAMDEAVQTLHDQLHQATDATERQMQELMNWAHEWLSASERIMGHGKKTTSKAAKSK